MAHRGQPRAVPGYGQMDSGRLALRNTGAEGTLYPLHRPPPAPLPVILLLTLSPSAREESLAVMRLVGLSVVLYRQGPSVVRLATAPSPAMMGPSRTTPSASMHTRGHARPVIGRPSPAASAQANRIRKSGVIRLTVAGARQQSVGMEEWRHGWARSVPVQNRTPAGHMGCGQSAWFARGIPGGLRGCRVFPEVDIVEGRYRTVRSSSRSSIRSMEYVLASTTVLTPIGKYRPHSKYVPAPMETMWCCNYLI